MNDLLDPHQLLDDKSLSAVVHRTLVMLKLAACKAAVAASDPHYALPADPRSFEQLFARRLATRPQKSRDRAAAKCKAALATVGPARARLFGDLAKVDVHGNTPIAARALHTAVPLAVDASHLRHVLTAVPTASPPPPPPPSGSSPPPGKLLKVRIHRVICADETDGFLGSEAGSDEIAMGGVTIDETGDTKEVPAFMVGTGFEDGVKKIYDPPKTFATFDLTEGGNHWPKSYSLAIYLAEIDNGGFPGFLKDLLDEVKGWVLELVGGAIGSVLGPIGTVLGTLLGAVLDLFFGWLISIWEDDMFPGIAISTPISGPQHHFASGTRTSSIKKYWTAAHGGKYWVWLDWQITT